MAAIVRYNYARLGVLAVAVFIIISTFFFVSLPSDRAFSCRTLSTCFQAPPEYPHDIPDDFFENNSESEGEWFDGTLYYRREVQNARPKVLFLSLNKDTAAWGKDFMSTGRTIQDFINLLVTTDLDFTTVSLGVMTASHTEFEAIKRATSSYPFARISVFYQKNDEPKVSKEDKGKPEVEHKRRARLSTLRNYLMLRSLVDEPHMVWVDADIAEFSPGVVQAMIGHAEEREDVGLVTAHCSIDEPGEDYDKKAWSLDKEAPGLMGSVAEKDFQQADYRLQNTRHQVKELIKGTSDNDLIPLDSVGGTILYVRSNLVHRGVSFPPFHVVGATWSRDGWAGIETEGICYVAQQLGGSGCFLLGGNHSVRHADSG